ncbi:MAG: DNA-directed RNA polymerase subunit L [archaeon]
MKIEFLVEKKNEIEFKMAGERHTFPALLKAQLLKDPEVVFLAYKMPHPLASETIFYVRTEGKDAKKAVAEACREIASTTKEFGQALKKALK